MRFLITGGAESSDTRPGAWGGHSWQTAFRYRGDLGLKRPGGVDPSHVQALIDALVADVSVVDGVLCESGLALVLAREWAVRGLPPRVVLALQVTGMGQLDAVRAWYQSQLGEDPWPLLAKAPWVSWLAPSARQAELLAPLVPAERIHSLRFSASLVELMLPGGDAFSAPPNPKVEAAGKVLFAGNGCRDWATILRTVMELPDLPCLIVGGSRSHFDKFLAHRGHAWPANLQHIPQVPLQSFVEHMQAAQVVVVPLLRGDGDGGHTTIALANRLGVPVVCTDAPTLADYTQADRSCLVAATEDAAGLGAAVRRALTEPTRSALVQGGIAFEKGLDTLFTTALQQAIAGALRHLDR